MKNAWPNLTDFIATSGRLATKEDTQANQAAFLLHNADGERIGLPVDLLLPQFAFYLDHETHSRERCVMLQAEEADGKVYFGGWLIDEQSQVVGFDSDFELLGSETPH